MQKEAYFTGGKIFGNIAYYCLQYQVHLGNLQHAGWFKIIHTVNGYADMQNDFVKYFSVHIFFLMLEP